ncbi:MAG: uracil-DNA glycosylase [Treponema sp.]|nr:uracil-DNA glycosylase [Treponema sp.]
MTANDKNLLYNLLKSAATYECGYIPQVFQYENLSFKDDCEKNNESKNTTESPSQKKSNGITLQSIAEKVRQCKNCQLAKTRHNVVPGEGVEKPLVLVIGEAPGRDEDLSGRPFVGAAGQLLDKMLIAIQLSRTTNCHILNIVKCRPPMNRDPKPEEMAACSSFLEMQIHVLKPKMILGMGRIAAQALLKTTMPIGRLRGNFYEINGIPFMATYHPSALLRNEALKRPAWEDLKAFRKRLIEIAGDYTKQ